MRLILDFQKASDGFMKMDLVFLAEELLMKLYTWSLVLSSPAAPIIVMTITQARLEG